MSADAPGRVELVRAEDLLDDAPSGGRPARRGLSRGRQLAGLALSLCGLPLLTLVLDHLSSLSVEGDVLLYLLAVVLVALVGGMVVALLTAAVAALLINYFFVTPVHTFDVAHGDQALALIVFVAVAAIVSGAVELANRRAMLAELAAAQAETLSSLAGADLDEEETLHGVLDRARETFGMESVILKRRDRHAGTWHDVEQAGWGQIGHDAPLRFDVAISGDLRLVGRGPALFAEDQRVLRAFAAAAQTAYDGRRLSERAEEAKTLAVVDRQRTALLAGVGHDLRTPLAAIKASVTTLRQTDVAWTDQERDELLATIEDSADRLDAVVANLLDASRLQAGALSVHVEPVALDQVVAAAVLAVPDAGSRVAVEVPEDMPLVAADAGLLERVLVNLMDNALRHGGASPIEVRAVAGSTAAKLEVVDHGPGVSAEQRARLFAPFQRVGDRDSATGVGLGLWVARGFAEAMDGALVADASPGGGLTMRLRLPLSDAPA